MITISDNKGMSFLWGLLIVLILHCNDVKISVIKISEIFLMLYGVFNFTKFHKVSKMFFTLFTFYLVITFLNNPFYKFDYSVAKNILQQPYICSIGRYVELLCCLSFVELFLSFIRRIGKKKAISIVLSVNSYFCIGLLLLYVLEIIGAFVGFDVITESGRLRGFFNEGGPFGLLMALLLILSIIFKSSYINKIVLLLCLFLSFSKAGTMLLLIVGTTFLLYKCRYSKKLRFVFLSILIPLLVLIGYAGYNLVYQYGAYWADSDTAFEYALNNPDDYSFTAGRVSGVFIGYQMFVKNPVLGIGLGNYPILRNNKEYRTFFPSIPIYDASGMGGVFDVLIQHGLIGLLLFFTVLYKLYKRSDELIFLGLFVAVMMCGVQLTFVYPWLLIALNEKYCKNVRKQLLLAKQLLTKKIISKGLCAESNNEYCYRL